MEELRQRARAHARARVQSRSHRRAADAPVLPMNRGFSLVRCCARCGSEANIWELLCCRCHAP